MKCPPCRVRAKDYRRAAANVKVIRMLFGTKAYAVAVAYDLDPTLRGDIKKRIHTDVHGYIEAVDSGSTGTKWTRNRNSLPSLDVSLKPGPHAKLDDETGLPVSGCPERK